MSGGTDPALCPRSWSATETPAAGGHAGPPIPQSEVGGTCGQPCLPPHPSPLHHLLFPEEAPGHLLNLSARQWKAELAGKPLGSKLGHVPFYS